jgi:YD repeat-containing protein
LNQPFLQTLKKLFLYKDSFDPKIFCDQSGAFDYLEESIIIMNTARLCVISFVKSFIHNLRYWFSTFISHSGNLNSIAQKSLASMLITFMLLPMILFGQAKAVYAAPSPINLSAVSQSFPNPYNFSAPDPGNSSAPLFSPAAFLGVWDYISSLFTSSENSFDGCPTGYTSLGGVITADPTVSVLSNKMLVFVRGTDGAVYYQITTDGSNYSGYLGLGGIITSNPASATNGSTLTVEATGTDSNRYYQTTTDGYNFSGWTGGTVTTQTNASVGFNGQIYTFVKGTGANPPLCYQGITPTPTPTPTSTPPPSSPNSPPVQTATTLPTSTNLSRVRLAPVNGTGGTNLYSRNFGWGTPLAGLSGRGMNAGFGISYNSLIWMRVGNDMVFNPNQDNVTPGFRFGYSVIEPSYSDPVTSKNTFMMVAPSGTRVEFRQIPASNDTYETINSSYSQLKVIDANNIVVTDTSGTNAYYELKAGAFRVASIKDRNGNYITVSHDTNGLLQSVTDTLGRVISVGYDNQGSPISVTQTRSTGTFTYASLTYGSVTLGTNFTGLNTVGIAGNGTFKALTKITYADGSSTQFDYNNYGQVWKVSNYAADNHQLNYTAVNLQNVTGAQTDVPRFSEIRNWAERFNSNSSNVAQETVTSIVYQENAGFILPNNTTVTGTLLHVTAPDGTVSRNFVGGTSAGWQEGLPILSEDWANESSIWNRKRWNYSVYTQDDVNLAYPLNPRVIESKIGDSANVRRSTIEYWTQSGSPNAALFGLAKEVKVYDADQTTVLKRSTTDYNLDSTYLSRRIIGLPQKSELFDQSNNLMSKVTYQYDEGNFSGTNQTIAPVQHDTTNFGTGFVAGRGNSTSTTRWDVTAPNNTSAAITNYAKYDIAGNQVATIDPLNRTVSISYADSYDDNQNRNSYAYPTQVTDPSNNSSTIKYRFDTGANVYATSPAPAGNTVGKTTSRIYDSIGRLEKETVNNTGAYMRYVYPTNANQSLTYSTVVDTNNNGADAADEVLTESFTDGAGRVISSRTEHPGSTGGWAATLTVYDVMGRVKSSSVPTEINNSWQPAGDDATRGFLWTTNEYDWKGRITRTINTDGTDKLYSYEGCGCAGGQVTTVQSELVSRDDNPTTIARRTQKVYADILDRSYKTETLNWDGSVYSSTKNFYNGRDQVILTRQYVGTEASPTYQDTTMTYDGHARLATQHRPEQNANTNTTYSYYADDRAQQVTDARGATVNYTYNSRGLVTQISTVSPNTSTIPNAPTVTYSYDNVGNRTGMTDGLGSQTYEYDQLSRLTAETRQFNDTLANAPLSNNRFKIQYAYSLSGQLNSVTDPYGQQINYSHDKVGRLNSVTGSSFAGLTNYAANAQYRAWGGMKHLEYGSGLNQDATYNNRLQTETFKILHPTDTSRKVFDKQYQYYSDGNLKFIDESAATFDRYDRLYIYDHAARIRFAKSGIEASGGTVNDVSTYLFMPYRQSYTFNAFNNMTARESTLWRNEFDWNSYTSYQNNRESGLTYDAEGNAVYSNRDDVNFQYDAGNRTTQTWKSIAYEINSGFDGNGVEIKRSIKKWNTSYSSWEPTKNTYNIYSSLLKQTLSETFGNGSKKRSFVIGGSSIIARQAVSEDGTQSEIAFQYTDASRNSLRLSAVSSGALTLEFGNNAEFDPLGNNIGTYSNLPSNPNQNNGLLKAESPSNYREAGVDSTCTLNGISGPCSVVESLYYGSGIGERAWHTGLPIEMTGRRPNNSNNPININNSIRQELFPDSYEMRGAYRDYDLLRRERGSDRFLTANYDSSYLNYLLGNSTRPEKSGQDIKVLNTCKKFAEAVQYAANYASQQNLDDTQKAVLLGTLITTWYTGGSWEVEGGLKYKSRRGGLFGNMSQSRSQSGNYDPSWSGAAADQGWMGYAGFKNMYLDSGGDNTEDVTHHVAAYLALGATNSPTTLTVISFGDRVLNDGDYRAANAAYGLGLKLFRHWGRSSTIGEAVQRKLCNSNETYVYESESLKK